MALKEPLVVYDPIGCCIYCGRIVENLGQEHIVPLSLDGKWVLPRSTCRSCERAINTFETTCSRSIFGDFRVHYNADTRRPGDRPSTIRLGRKGGGFIEISRSEYPPAVLFFVFSRAGFLTGTPKTLCKFEPAAKVFCDTDALEAFKVKYPEWDERYSLRACQNEQARLIAKIAYCYAVAILGYGSFTPLILNIVLCRTNKFAYLVGGESELPPKTGDTGHTLGGIEFVVSPAERKARILVNVRLFGNGGFPQFHAIVGEFELDNPKHLTVYNKYLESAESIQIMTSSGQPIPVGAG